MADKEQIMVDGVDVSRCKSYRDADGYSSEDEEFITGCCDNAAVLDSYGELMYYIPCKNNNCYFKQLARKTQECESLKEEIKILQDNFDTVTRDCNDLIEDLRQECDTLKSQLDFEVQQKECIEQECGELKRELDKEHLLMLEKQDKATKYFLVINGIKEYIYNNTDFDVNDSIQSKTSGYDILQIINGL